MLKPLRPTYLIAFIFVLISLIFSLFSWTDALDNGLLNLYTKIRGPRQISDNIIFIYIGDEDIQALGGWPVTRDYYAYFIHLLTVQKVKAIGLDLLLDSESQTWPEYDRMLASFMKASGSIVLPYVFQISGDSINSVNPAKLFYQQSHALGFGNLGESAKLSRMPVCIHASGHYQFSFGTMLAKIILDADSIALRKGSLYFLKDEIPVRKIHLDKKGRIIPDHFGGPDQIQSLGFVEAVKLMEEYPDSISWKDKCILLGNTATSLPTIKQTSLNRAFPATLAHATVLENILAKRCIRPASWLVSLILTILLIGYLTWKPDKNFREGILKNSCVITGYLLVGFWGFLWIHTLIPAMPILLFALASICDLTWIYRNQKKLLLGHNQLLRAQIRKKRKQIKDIEENLKLIREEADETASSLLEKEEAVERLKAHLNDLEVSKLPRPLSRDKFDDLIFHPDSPMAEMLKTIEKIGDSDISVLITGETGTGKELIAQALHRQSKRSQKPFVPVNCGALPEGLLESELFGHEKGSFTGAVMQRRGRFEIAHRGTLFLDEITETSSSFQARLLRVLQEGTIERLGGEKTIEVDVRIIAASNKDVEQQVIAGHFRQDLFYRLNGFILSMPPLRERRMDIPFLVSHFIKKYSKHELDISSEAMHQLTLYHWPGNVRELENAIQRSVVLARGDHRNMIQVSDLPQSIVGEQKVYSEIITIDRQILNALQQFEFSHRSIQMTADVLGNKDRGTVTEYLRGMCFKTLVNHNYNIEEAAADLAGTNSQKVRDRVIKKMRGYLKNIKSQIKDNTKDSDLEETLPAAFSGLPKKYHPYLIQVIQNFDQIEK